MAASKAEPRTSEKTDEKKPLTKLFIKCFHYTSKSGWTDIRASKYIRISRKETNHAHSGEGVYLTTLPPEKGKEKIAKNNWMVYGKTYISKGLVDLAIELELPDDKVINVGTAKRDIRLHREPILLEDYTVKVWEVPDKPAEAKLIYPEDEPVRSSDDNPETSMDPANQHGADSTGKEREDKDSQDDVDDNNRDDDISKITSGLDRFHLGSNQATPEVSKTLNE